LAGGNELVCQAIELLAAPLLGREIEELMADWGSHFRRLADHPQLRWLGPHKGVVHLALAAITNACFDQWAKTRGLPLWRLLLDLTPDRCACSSAGSYRQRHQPGDQYAGQPCQRLLTRLERPVSGRLVSSAAVRCWARPPYLSIGGARLVQRSVEPYAGSMLQ